MAPLIALMLGTLAARLVGWLGAAYVGSWPAAVAVGLAAMFLVTGIAHFVNPLRRDLIAIVPPRLPAAGLLVTVTGVLELLGAVGLLHPPTRPAAAISLGDVGSTTTPVCPSTTASEHPPCEPATTGLPTAPAST